MTIHLSPRGGILSGTVTDKVSGAPVKGISISYLDVDGKASGGAPLPSDGEFHVTSPTQCDLVIVAFAKGYKGWVYTDRSNPSRPVLRLAAGERKLVAIELEPTVNRETPSTVENIAIALIEPRPMGDSRADVKQ